MVQGLLSFIAVSFGMAILMVVWALCMVFWRYCCCCCCKRTQRCKCGGKYPTRKTMWVGYSILPGHKFGYSRCGRIASLVYLICFIAAVRYVTAPVYVFVYVFVYVYMYRWRVWMGRVSTSGVSCNGRVVVLGTTV